MLKKSLCWLLAIAATSLSGCGTYVPQKDPFHPDSINQVNQSHEGLMEANLVGNIRCEIENAIYKAGTDLAGGLPDLTTNWGTQVTLKLTWDEMSGLAPNVSFINPMPLMQSFSLNVGATASAHATRVETVTFLFENRALYQAAQLAKQTGITLDCTEREKGIMIDSNLKIGDFVYDKATLASTLVATTVAPSNPQFSVFQEEITFVGTFGGNATPVWKLTKISSGTAGNLLSATRTTTGDVLITLGALMKDSKGNLLPQLAEAAASQHNAGVTGGAVASQINSQSH